MNLVLGLFCKKLARCWLCKVEQNSIIVELLFPTQMFCSAHYRFKANVYDMEKQDLNAILGFVSIGVNFWYPTD